MELISCAHLNGGAEHEFLADCQSRRSLDGCRALARRLKKKRNYSLNESGESQKGRIVRDRSESILFHNAAEIPQCQLGCVKHF